MARKPMVTPKKRATKPARAVAPPSASSAVAELPAKKRKKPGPAKKRKTKAQLQTDYAKKKRAAAEKSRSIADAGREIGPLPPVEDQARRDLCGTSLRLFACTYLPKKFYLSLSRDHPLVVERLERAVREGGLFAIAMPRGRGKTEWLKAACLFAILYGLRKFVIVLGATKDAAVEIAEDIKAQLEANDLLAADFPEATFPVRALGQVAQRAKGQRLDGKPTRLLWHDTIVRLAAIPGSPCSGAIIRTVGITGHIRGRNMTGPNGESLRPDLVLGDDLQTRESAHSPAQTVDRLSILRGDVLGLGGQKSIACLLALTVITKNDLADQVLDPELNPQWLGVRTRLVDKWPTNRDLWNRYFELRSGSFKAGGNGAEARQHYREHKAAMDEGADLPWPEYFDAAKFGSAVEEAECKRHDNPVEFASEFQNLPLEQTVSGVTKEMSAGQVMAKLNRVPRGVVPRNATRLVSFIDCGSTLLWWGVAAFDEKFNGAMVDYGAWPRQTQPYYSKTTAAPSLEQFYPRLTDGQRLYAGLRDLTAQLFAREWKIQETGNAIKLDKALIDSGYLTDVVFEFIRKSQHTALLASKGWAQSRNTTAMSDWPIKPDEPAGVGWRLSPPGAGRGRLLKTDVDHWKSFAADRFMTEPGAPGCFELFGDAEETHQLYADHVTAEYGLLETMRGKTAHFWCARPNRDNDLLDVTVGCFAAAAVSGLKWSTSAALGEKQTPKKPKGPKLSYQERFRQANASGVF